MPSSARKKKISCCFRLSRSNTKNSCRRQAYRPAPVLCFCVRSGRQCRCDRVRYVFFFNDTATTEIYTLSLHDALPICQHSACHQRPSPPRVCAGHSQRADRKSTRLNSSHPSISYAVFCLKKKTTK